MKIDFAEQLNAVSKTRDEYLQKCNDIKEKEEQVRIQKARKEFIEKQNKCFGLIRDELLKMASEGLFEYSNGKKKIVGTLIFESSDDHYKPAWHNHVDICTRDYNKRHIDLDKIITNTKWFCIFYHYRWETKKRFLFGTQNIRIPENETSELENFISNFNHHFNNVVKITGYAPIKEKMEYDSTAETYITIISRAYDFECCF